MRFISRFKLLCAAVALVSSVAANAAELPVEPKLRIETRTHTQFIDNVISSDKARRWLVTCSRDKTARIWDATNGHLLKILRIPIFNEEKNGELNTAVISPDGQLVAVAAGAGFDSDANSTVFLFDRASGKLLRRLKGVDGQIISIAFSPDGQALAIGLRNKSGLRILAIKNGRVIAQDLDYGSHINEVQFNAEGLLVAMSFNSMMKLYQFDGKKLTLLTKRVPRGVMETHSSFSPDGRHIAVASWNLHNTFINVLNSNDLSLDFSVDTSNIPPDMASGIEWSLDGETLYASVRNIYGWTKQGAGAQEIVIKQIDGKSYSTLVSLHGGQLAFSTGRDWGIQNAEGVPIVFNASGVMNFFPTKLNEFLLSTDGTKVQFGGEGNRILPRVFDVLNRSWLGTNTPNLYPAQSDPSLKIGLQAYWSASLGSGFYLNGKAIITRKGFDSFTSQAVFPNKEAFVVAGDFLQAFDRSGNPLWEHVGAQYVNVSQDGRWVVAAYRDGTIRWHRASDGEEQLAFFLHADKKRWVMWTPSGYYDASPGAEDLIGWHVNRGKDHAPDFFPASRFRERFFRPDVLTKVLETQDEAEAVRLANAESGRRTQTVTSIAQVFPPVVEIVFPAQDSTVRAGKIKVRYTVRTAADAPVTAMRVRVNGLLQSDTRALKLVKSNDETQEIEVTLPEQDAEIQLFAENKYSTSTPAILRLKWAGKSTAKVSKPKLYVLAVGVSKYKNSEYNLGLAAKDASDFAAVLQKQQGKLYREVEVKLLTDDKATRDDVLEGLDWLKQQVTPNDVGMMFVAGHGMNDKLGGYYFMPHNADPDKLARTGVSQSDIKQTFANLPGHTVFFIDTCYSGGALGNVRTTGFVNDLASAENGAVVFTASSAGQLSQENSSWGNGAFTKSVVEGLNGKADAFNSGVVTVKGLDFYVDGRVKSLTNGQQTPVSISPGGLSDFPITGGKQ